MGLEGCVRWRRGVRTGGGELVLKPDEVVVVWFWEGKW